jgi:hypothetical protein
MAQQFILKAAQEGAPVPTIEQWIATLSGSDQENALRIQRLQEAHWLAGNEDNPLPEFVTIWDRYILENNLIHELVD